MVTADRLEANNTFRLTLKPNRSISWKGNLLPYCSGGLFKIKGDFLYPCRSLSCRRIKTWAIGFN